MIAYTYTLTPSDNKKDLAKRAIVLAQRASAVDSGRYRRGWRAVVSNDRLVVSNNVKYAMFVELGTIYTTVNKHRVRDALKSLNLGTPTVTIGTGVQRIPTQATAEETEEARTPVPVIPILPKLPKLQNIQRAVSPIIEQISRRKAFLTSLFGLSFLQSIRTKEDDDTN
tara:strand:+ start:30706 stop:31212 length:507 start_codon:yes stop_codon:yes gene_type:complete